VAIAVASEPEPAPQGDRGLRRVLAVVWGPAEGKVGLAILAGFAFVVAFGPLVAPHDPYEIGLTGPNGPLSSDHLLGTDQLGRDVLSRLFYGARSVIGIPLLATTLAFAAGGLAGMLAGYAGGVADAIASRVIDILLSLPPLLIVLVVIAALGNSSTVLVLSVAIVYSPRVARVLRGATQGVAEREYVQAAQARGEHALGIVLRELLPNILPTVFVEFAVRLTYVIIFVATLNFLGLGVAPPSPNWGVMVAESRPTVLTAPVTTLAPTLAIGLVSVGISLVADAVTQRLGLEGESEFLR
jgi:peptide/nickel transport system permease protein